MAQQKFLFNTGVNVYKMEYADKGKPKYYDPTDEIINGVRHIPFYCNDVPEGATFVFACDYLDHPDAKNMIVREIVAGNIISKYAFFKKPQ